MPSPGHRYPELQPFVVAAECESLDAAGRLLFIHGSDLAWNAPAQGLYLVGAHTGPDFERAREATGARAGIAMAQLRRTFDSAARPFWVSVLSILAGKTPMSAEKLNAALARLGFADVNQERILEQLRAATDNLREALDGVAALLLWELTELEKRQLAATGMSREEFRAMLTAALAVGGVCEPVVRVAFAPGSLVPELSLGAACARPPAPGERYAHSLTLFRLLPALEVLKRPDDHALPCFIAEYLNSRVLGSAQAAALIRPAGPAGTDLDVVVARLGLGMEVKLYAAPAAANDHKAESEAPKLAEQLKAYAEAGCRTVVYVTNWPEQPADRALNAAIRDAPWAAGRRFRAVAGFDALWDLLDRLESRLDKAYDKSFAAELAREAGIEGDDDRDTRQGLPKEGPGDPTRDGPPPPSR